jgi:hypothetical protein
MMEVNIFTSNWNLLARVGLAVLVWLVLRLGVLIMHNAIVFSKRRRC